MFIKHKGNKKKEAFWNIRKDETTKKRIEIMVYEAKTDTAERRNKSQLYTQRSNTFLYATDRNTKENTRKGTEYPDKTINQLDTINIYRRLQSTQKECTKFSSPYRIFIKKENEQATYICKMQVIHC